MAFTDNPAHEFGPGPGRTFIGLIAAAVIPSLLLARLLGPPSEMIGPILILALVSVFLVYLPLVWWRLPRSKHPLLTCVALGAISAPGPIGLTLLFGMTLTDPGTGAALFLILLILIVPFGILGGFIFWLSVVWRNPDCAPEARVSNF